jgi:hypothetical protein
MRNMPFPTFLTERVSPMKMNGLSYNARKALTVHIGEAAGTEIANLISQMSAEIEELRRTKVNVTKIVPGRGVEHRYSTEEPV